MAVRYYKTRLALGAVMAGGVVGGSAYFAGTIKQAATSGQAPPVILTQPLSTGPGGAPAVRRAIPQPQQSAPTARRSRAS